MRLCMPEVKRLQQGNAVLGPFDRLSLSVQDDFLENAAELLDERLWDIPRLRQTAGGTRPVRLRAARLQSEQLAGLDAYAQEMLCAQGYCLQITNEQIEVFCNTNAGFQYAISTLKQLLEGDAESGWHVDCCRILDWPSVEYRSLSTTFAWYAGYGRFGFDMQLWGLDEWKRFLRICADYKINQLNLCLYGYWPYEMPEYPETVLRGLRMKLWNAESESWVETEYLHPNVAREFLPELIRYGHALGIGFFAYIGLNSYSGGYSNAHREKRMKMPQDSKFINDFDSLCLSDPTTIDYLKYCMKRVVDQGFDGIDFEESEEAFWYCGCEACKKTFWKDAETPEQALHNANTYLLKILYDELKRLKPDIVIGLRAWRQPPLVRSEELIRSMVESIPEDVVLFWAPGQYVEDSEFDKWIAAFGRRRIRARDTEAIGFAAGLGRLIRPFRFNGLRAEEESITQYVEEDIRQHRGSAARRVAGINGYQFEWYGFFMAFFAHAYYGWGGEREPEDFCRYALRAVFGPLEEKIWDVMHNMLTIHESQLNLFALEFPFARNKIEKRDIPRLEQAIADYPRLAQELDDILAAVRADERLRAFAPHFKKWRVSLDRCRVIYDMGLVSLQWAEAEAEEEKRQYLLELDALNEKEFDIIKANYFDVCPCTQTGVKSCMIPYHELKRSIHNLLDPAHADPEPVYLGVESLGWLWA